MRNRWYITTKGFSFKADVLYFWALINQFTNSLLANNPWEKFQGFRFLNENGLSF
jgi:hypothetical protein